MYPGAHARETLDTVGPLFSVDADTVYLSPAPMYHSAPLGFSMGVQTLGGTVVILERFDPEAGVSIYPQEIEDVLVLHPEVADVAVFGVPNDDFGEEVKAVVQPADPAADGDGLAQRLLAYCREHLAAYKVPRSVDFEAELPRLSTGKLYKRLLRDRYWGRTDSRIV